jgi:sugar-specific transcriptional regulator TrmB
MKNGKLLEILKNIGLDETEAQVYLTSLSLGPNTVLNIARGSNVKRTTIYGVIESLQNKGLMRIELRGLKQVYVAENPEKLQVMLELREREFRASLPEFMALHTLQGTEGVIKFYTGMKAMQQIYLNTLKEIRPHEDYLVIANQEKWYELDPQFSQRYIEERAKLNIKTRLLFQDSKIAQEHKSFERNFNQTVKILPEGTSLHVDTLLLPKKLVILELLPPYKTIVIENQSIIELHREMFELVWTKL